MKKHFYAYGLVALVVLVTLAWWFRYPASAPFNPADKAAAMQSIWAGSNLQPQDFYGKVVDQYGQPVEGVTALGTLMWIQGMDVGEKTEQHTTLTDQNGEFQFTGFRAWRLAVAVSKKGYEMGRSPGVYQAPNAQDVTNPKERAIFKMWKLKGPEPIIHARAHAYVPCDGTSTAFNLATGQATLSGGDLIVKLTRNPVNIDRGKPFSWSATLQIAKGGLFENSDIYPNEAPAEGYQPLVTISMPADDKNWTSTVNGSYYFKNGSNYGRMTINIVADFQPPPTLFDANIYMNPSGSRNLEFDSSKQINP